MASCHGVVRYEETRPVFCMKGCMDSVPQRISEIKRVKGSGELNERLKMRQDHMPSGLQTVDFSCKAEENKGLLTSEAETLNDHAVISYSQGDLREATQLLRRALEIDPSHLDSLINLSRILVEQNDLSDLERLAHAMLRHHGEKAEVQQEAGIIFEVLVKTYQVRHGFGQSLRAREEGKNPSGENVSFDNEGWESPDMSAHKGQPVITVGNRDALLRILTQVCYYPHGDLQKGKLSLEKSVFDDPDRETNICISPGARIDLTGSVTIGPWCMIGSGTVILTHDHFHEGREVPLLKLQEQRGIKWKDKKIGSDVWLHGCTVLAQVTKIPDGVIVGVGSVLTRNPGPYEIWAGNPAVKVGER